MKIQDPMSKIAANRKVNTIPIIQSTESQYCFCKKNPDRTLDVRTRARRLRPLSGQMAQDSRQYMTKHAEKQGPRLSCHGL